MIQVEKDFTNSPDSLLSEKCKGKIKEALENGNNHDFKTWYKKADTKQLLQTVYNNKCAYCEGQLTITSPIEVEHYRPKKPSRTKPPKHNGYHWLGYEWTNLLLACDICNKSKGNHFPLEARGVRLTNPPINPDGSLDTNKCKPNYIDLQNEYPLLLNPEIDDPENHIIFLPDGRAWGITSRGEETIEKCKLNRDGLVIKGRKALIDSFEKRITRTVNHYIINQISYFTFEYTIKTIIAEIWELRLPINQFSRLGFFMFDKFELFFLRKFVPKVRKKLNQIYIAFKIEFIPQNT